jgi:hypothetical protein
MAKKWIQESIKRPGALRKKLRVKKGENIPVEELEPKKGDTTRTKKQKAWARTVRKMHKK